MTTPNTTEPSDEARIIRWDPALSEVSAGMFSLQMDPSTQGDWVYYDDHLAALARARDEARRKALEEAAQACERSVVVVTRRPYTHMASMIRALITNTPQGETKEKS